MLGGAQQPDRKLDGGPAVQLHGVTKRFGATLAVDDVTLELRRAQVHGWVGQNGAGKSTCLGMVAGRVPVSEGSVTVSGVSYPRGITPQFAQAAGVSAIYQELAIVPAMSALENAFLGRMRGRMWTVDRRSCRHRFRAMCERLGVRIDPDVPAGRLSVADQQMVEIIRALSMQSQVLLLDEPTSALAPQERRALFSAVTDLRRSGTCLVLVSHDLDEVLENSDVVSVFRDGRLIETRNAAAWTPEQLVQKMLGRELTSIRRIGSGADTHRRTAAGEPVMRVEELSAGRVLGATLHVGAGEVVGIAGLVGSGRSTLLRAISGVQPASAGRMWIGGSEVRPPRSPRDAWRLRIATIPEDRKASGIIPAMSSRENMILSDFAATASGGLIKRAAVRRKTDELATAYGLQEQFLDRAAGNLSGGNQQKLLVARSVHRMPRVLVADEATRGIDVGAKGQILETLRSLAARGLGVLFVSAELEEVVAISDRIYVLRGGRLVAELTAADGITQDDILKAAFGVGEAAGAVTMEMRNG